MKKIILSLASVAALAACGGDEDEANPITGGPTGATIIPTDETEVTASGIPVALAANVVAASFNRSAGTLTMTLTSLDASSFSEAYTREPDLDVPGYQAFTQQENALNRLFVAVAGSSPDGTVSAVAVTDGGQFNRFFGGGNYQRNGTIHSLPDTGLATYAGTYAGVTNIGVTNGDQLLDLPASTDQSIRPRQPLQVQGEIIINADFTDNSINGEVFNRQLRDFPQTATTTVDLDLPDMSLTETAIADDGTFAGGVEFSDGNAAAGDYGGVFGGNSASAVAGVTYMNQFDDRFDNEEEFGTFSLGRCGTAGDASLCDAISP